MNWFAVHLTTGLMDVFIALAAIVITAAAWRRYSGQATDPPRT